MGCRHFLVACLLIVVSVGLCSSSSSRCNLAQRDALLRIQSPSKLLSWNSSEDCCTWTDVACDHYGNVIKLNLVEFTQDDTLLLNSSIFDLRFLQDLSLGNTDPDLPFYNFNASIPSQIGILTELRQLTLYYFMGPIPSSIGNLTKLRRLTLSLGITVGNIPDSIGNLRQLTELSISSYNLTGTIPDSIGNLSQLKFLGLMGSGLSGSIPDSFRRLKNLESLGIGFGVTGNLPSFIFDLPNLKYLSAHNNRLQGSLPRNIRADSKLEYLFLSDNNLTGTVPAWIFTRRLMKVSLENNNFSGPIEPFREPRVSYLQSVRLTDNRIEGIPTSLFNLKNVTELLLGGNKLSGALDFELIGGMERLSLLDLSWNEGLTLKTSKRVVRYPPSSFELQIDHCGLTEFPNFLSSMNGLYQLKVNDNKMKGGIDLSRGWKDLRDLDASNNNLGGLLMAPSLALVNLNVSHNHFTGKIPMTYCRPFELDLSSNKISQCAHFKHQCKNILMQLAC